MSNELQTAAETPMQTWRSPQEIVAQVRHIQEIMRAVMREGEHYGRIPGGKKQCLFKSGAEVLGLTFRLLPEFHVTDKAIGEFHREIIVKCTLRDPMGREVGQGVGSCSTMESKYRWRSGADLENTGKPVPKGYWDIKRDDPAKAQAMLGGKGFVAKKDDNGVWMIHSKSVGDRSENPDIADTWNTVLKMAKKRAHVDATITATATSDMFTQDLEDLPKFGVQEGAAAPDPTKEAFPGDEMGEAGMNDAMAFQEAEAIRADIYSAGAALPESTKERIQADIEAAGNDLDRLGKILVSVRRVAPPKTTKNRDRGQDVSGHPDQN